MADGVSYGGQALPLDFNRQIAEFVSRRWPESRWPTSCGRTEHPLRANPFANRSLGGRFALPYPELPAPRLNEVIIPTGASRYGRAMFLIGGDALESLSGSSSSAASASEEPCADFYPLVIEYGGTRFEWQMAMLTPVLLDATGRDALWLLPLVDERYFWRQRPANAPVQRGDSWATLFESLGTAIDQALSPGDVAGVHGFPDIESFADLGVSATQAIDAAALSLGLRAVMNSAGTLELKTAADSNTILEANLPALNTWAGGAVDHYGMPEGVSLVTRKAFDLYGLFDETAITESEGSAGSTPGCVLGDVVIHTPRWLEYFDGQEDSDSRAKVDNLAATIANNLVLWGNKQHSVSVAGVAEWTLSAHDDFKSVYVPGTDKVESVSTHVASLPSDFFPIVHLGNVDYRLNFSRVRGIAVGPVVPGEQIEIQNLIGMDGDTAGITRNLMVDNTHDWSANAGATVRAEYNETERVWEAYQVDCPSGG